MCNWHCHSLAVPTAECGLSFDQIKSFFLNCLLFPFLIGRSSIYIELTPSFVALATVYVSWLHKSSCSYLTLRTQIPSPHFDSTQGYHGLNLLNTHRRRRIRQIFTNCNSNPRVVFRSLFVLHLYKWKPIC